MQESPPPVAVVTGASSGIGWATACRLTQEGFEVLAVARRADRLADLARRCGARPYPCDVTDPAAVAALGQAVPTCAVLVNNAGGAHGLAPISDAEDADWETMYATNVLGVMRVTRALLPALRASGDGRIVIVSSVAGHEVYPGGGGYTAAKHAASAIRGTLRLELLGAPIRVIEIAPGLVETEFSVVRFGGDTGRAAAVYEGLTPLGADDVADAIAWAVTRPAHVNVDRVDLLPRDQADARTIHRRNP